MKKDHEKRPEEIERDILQTRADMSATIDAIQSKLTPGQMMDQAIGYLRQSLPAEFGHNLSDAVRHNPVPVALIGIGIAWMAISGRKGAPRYSYESDFGNQDFSTDEEGESLGERTHDMAQRARAKAADARAGVADTVRSARDSMHRVVDRSQQSYERAKSSITDLLDEQPLIVGALGLAVGAALGASLPRTETEDRLLGETRDDLLDSASDTAREMADRAADTARDTADRAAGSVRNAMNDMREPSGRSTERPGVAHAAPSHAMASGDRGAPPAVSSGAATNSPFRNDSAPGSMADRPSGTRDSR